MRRLAPRLLPQLRILLLALLLPAASLAFLLPPPPASAAAAAPIATTTPSTILRAAALAPRSAAFARPGAARAAAPIAAPHRPYPRAFTTAAAGAATGGPSSSFMEAVTPTYIEPEELLELLKAKRRGDPGLPKLQIVDVRDDDYEGGRLPGAINVPSEEWGDDERIDALVAELKDRRLIIFHCMLSQVRGPFCAKRFMARLSLVLDEEEGDDGDGGNEKKEEEEKKSDGAMMTETGVVGGQGQGGPRVCVLRYGYQRWYERYRKEIGMVVPCDVDDDEEEEEEEEED